MNTKSNKIDTLMKELKVSRAEFADRLGVKPNAISNWRKREFGLNVVNKIVETYPQVSREFTTTIFPISF